MSEHNLQDDQRWTMRLLINILLVLAIMTLTLPFPASATSGFSQNENRIVLAAARDFGPAAFGKTSQTIERVRELSSGGTGPDVSPGLPAVGNSFTQSGNSNLVAGGASAYFIAEHILFRNGSRAISVRAPPGRFPD